MTPGMTSRRKLWLKLGALSLLSQALFPNQAQAQELTGGGGAYLSFAFGEKLGLGWGFEAFGTALVYGRAFGCSSEPRGGLGPLVQFGMVNLERPHIVLGLHGGAETKQRGFFALEGELGATFRWGQRQGVGLHTGLAPSLAFLNAFVRAEHGLDQYSVGGGVRLPSAFGVANSCSVGRPFRTTEGLSKLPSAWHSTRAGACEVEDESLLLAKKWEEDAQGECASVPAFLQLAAELLLAGAPETLVASALKAAEQEVHHALLASGMATRYAGHRVAAVMPTPTFRPPLPRRQALVRLAIESFADGCLAEGAAALEAREACKRTQDEQVRAVQGIIASDEAEHAELAWGVLGWALREGGNDVSEALRECLGLGPALSAGRPWDALPNLERLGHLRAADRQRIASKHAERCDRRLAVELGARLSKRSRPLKHPAWS